MTTENEEQTLYCICRKPYDENAADMIACDFCDEWYHISCIGLSQKEFASLKQKKYKCSACKKAETNLTNNEQPIKKKSVINMNDVPMLEFIDDKPMKMQQKPIKFQKKTKKKVTKKKLKGHKRLIKEGQKLLLKNTAGIGACPRVSFKDVSDWIAFIEGPQNTPYEGYRFYLSMKFDENYPFIAPKVVFKTKIFHCNVNSENGEICLNILKDDWRPSWTIEKILLSLCVLLNEPNAEDPLNAEVAELFITNRALHDRRAREWTERYAQNIKDFAPLSG